MFLRVINIKHQKRINLVRALSLLLPFLLLASCSGYKVPSSKVEIVLPLESDSTLIIQQISTHLEDWGFKNFGVDQSMIELLILNHPSETQEKLQSDEDLIQLLTRQYFLSNDSQHLSILITDFSDRKFGGEGFQVRTRAAPYLEVEVNNYNPDGFTKEGLEFHSAIVEFFSGCKFGQVEVTQQPQIAPEPEGFDRYVSIARKVVVQYFPNHGNYLERQPQGCGRILAAKHNYSLNPDVHFVDAS